MLFKCNWLNSYSCILKFTTTQSGQDTESVCSSVSTMSEEDPFFDLKDVWEESFTSLSRRCVITNCVYCWTSTLAVQWNISTTNGLKY